MKIGLVTYHRSPSYGACLQTYATVEYLARNGYDVEVIDYDSQTENKKINSLCFKENNRMIGYVTSFIKNVFFGKRKYIKRAFGNPQELYPFSARQYTNKQELNGVSYDVMISGSDQIWNGEITKGIDDVYLLQFGHADRRVSVASSMGSYYINEQEKQIFEKALKTYSSISVREEFARKQIQELTDKPIKMLMDPTFLLTREQWIDGIIARSPYRNTTEKYILTFFIHPDADCKDRIRAYADSMKLPVWSIQMTTPDRFGADKKILGATVADFLALIYHAELVITDSFHGVALSLNLQKNFVAFKNVANPVRVDQLLTALGIAQRIDMSVTDYCEVDYETVNRVLMPMVKDSQKWVLNAIGGYVDDEK